MGSLVDPRGKEITTAPSMMEELCGRLEAGTLSANDLAGMAQGFVIIGLAMEDVVKNVSPFASKKKQFHKAFAIEILAVLKESLEAVPPQEADEPVDTGN